MTETTVLAAVGTLAGAFEGLHVAAVYLLSFLAALCILIFVHEFGHFIVARGLGVGVTKFSFGFGPKVVGVKRGETEYLVSAIPLGGYVKLVGESEGEELPPGQEERSFWRKPARVKMAVVFAGPLGNLVFAVLVFWFVFLWGFPAITARIDVAPGSPAASAGLATGDVVTRVGDVPVANWEDLDGRVRKGKPGAPIVVTARRGTQEFAATVVPASVEARNEFGQAVRETGIGVLPLVPPRISEVVAGSPAARAGLAKGDLVRRVGSEPVATWEELAGRIRKSKPGEPLALAVLRGGSELEISVVPEAQEGKGPAGETVREARIGIVPAPETVIQRLSPLRAMVKAADKTWYLVSLTAEVVVKLVTRVVPAKSLGGPILIAQIAGAQARQGLHDFLMFLGLLSVNLAILNLLPIPILDGGHILFFVIEGVLRKPLSLQARAMAQQVGLALILMLVALVFYNDIARLIGG
ncbi:MAG: RIP metalloprotease RseP, partial [Deltaproteobacteria bacterium]